MFGKVLKYEMRATGFLYSILLGIGILCGVFTLFTTIPLGTSRAHYIMNYAEGGMMIIVSLCTMVMVLIPVLFFILTAIRYTKSMYGREGYLSHSLPVSPTSLVLGKFVSTIIWGLAVSALCCFLCIAIVYSIAVPQYVLTSDADISMWEATKIFWTDAKSIILQSDVWRLIRYIGISGILSILLFSNYIFISVTLANLPCFHKGNTVLAIVFFFLINYVENRIASFITRPFLKYSMENMMYYHDLLDIGNAFANIILIVDISYLLFAVIHLALVIWLVKKHTALQ